MNNKLTLLLKNKKSVISGAILGLSLFLVYLFVFYVPSYSTSVELYIRNIPKNNVINEYGSGPIIQSESGFSNPLFNLQKILESKSLASRIYTVLKQEYPQDLQKLKIKSEADWKKAYSKLIKTKIEPSTDIITVSFNWPDKENATKVLNIIVEQFKDVNLQIRKSVEVKQSTYLDNQVKELGNKLDNVRRQIKEFKLAHRVTDIENEGTELTKARVELEKDKELLKSDISYNALKLTNLGSQLKIPSASIALRATAIGDDTYLTKLNQDLATSEQNYSKLQATFTDNYPDVIAAKNEIKLINNKIKNRVNESLQNTPVKRGIYDKPSQEIVVDMAKAQAEKYSLKSRLNTLQKGIRYLQRKELQLPIKSVGLQELQKQEDALVDAYTTATQSFLESKIKENEIVDNIVTLGAPDDASFVSNIIIMKFAEFLIFGMLCALSISWIRGDLGNKWTSLSEIENVTGHKVLGIIPWLKDKEFSVTDFTHISSSFIDVIYGDIISNITSKASKENIKTITFISTQHSRSRSLIVPNIAISLARLKKSLIFIDTNSLEPGKLLKDLGTVRPEGLLDLLDAINAINEQISINGHISQDMMNKLIGETLVYINAGNNNDVGFYYVGINRNVDNVYEYIATRGFMEFVNYLKNYYEFILIDTPAKSYIFPEFSVLTEVSDASIIIAALSTGKTELIKVLDRFKKVSNKILGIIPREENSEIEKYFNIKTKEMVPR